MNRHDQNGSITLLLASVVVLATIICGLTLVKDSGSNPKDDTSMKIEAADNRVVSGSPEYLEIKEFGVKIKLNDDTRDLYYTIKTDTEEAGDNNTFAVLSTRRLTELEPKCEANADSPVGVDGIGIVFPFKVPEVSGSSSLEQATNDAIKVGGLYYTLSSPAQVPCADPDESSQEAVDLNNMLTNYLTPEKLEQL